MVRLGEAELLPYYESLNQFQSQKVWASFRWFASSKNKNSTQFVMIFFFLKPFLRIILNFYCRLEYAQDLPRTFPCHPWLDSPEGQASLRRVLVGYSFRDSNVGYCQVTVFVAGFLILHSNCNSRWTPCLQGLNYVAALLLLVMKTEEEAFWMLAVLLENVLVRDCYTDNLSGCHVEQRVFKDLLAKKCPR